MMNNLVKSNGLYVPPSCVQAKGLKKKKLFQMDQYSDRYGNVVNGWGINDAQSNTYFMDEERYTPEELDSIYTHSWLGRRVVEAIPKAATRKGYIISTKGRYFEKKKEVLELEDKAEQVKEKMEGWNSDRKLFKHAVQANLFGNAAKMYHLRDGFDFRYPVRPDLIEDIEDISIVDRFSVQPSSLYPDPRDKRHGKPMLWQVLRYPSAWSVLQDVVHDQRMSWLEGEYLTPRARMKNQGFGASVLQGMRETLKNHETSIQQVGAVIQDFVLKIVQLENMNELLEDDEGRDELDKRMQDIDLYSHSQKTVPLGMNEKFYKISTPIQGLVDLIVLLIDQVCAATGIAKSILFGNLTGTLGSSSGQHDNQNFFNTVETYQNKTLKKSLEFEFKLACQLIRVASKDLEINFLDVRDELAEKRRENEKRRAETWKISTEIAEKWQDAKIKDLADEIARRIEKIAA